MPSALKDNLFPPTDRALSALLDDLDASGQLDETLIVVAGEFGRTPKITLLPSHYKLPGRDHWELCKACCLQAVVCAEAMSLVVPMQLVLIPQISPSRRKTLPLRSITRWAFQVGSVA